MQDSEVQLLKSKELLANTGLLVYEQSEEYKRFPERCRGRIVFSLRELPPGTVFITRGGKNIVRDPTSGVKVEAPGPSSPQLSVLPDTPRPLTIQQLPRRLLQRIFGYFPPNSDDRWICRIVCRHWNDVLTNKHKEFVRSGPSLRCSSGFHEERGKRPTMEDAHVLLDNFTLPDLPYIRSFYGVYDGHGGKLSAKLTKMFLHHMVFHDKHYREGRIERGLCSAFKRTDKHICSIDKAKDSGNTVAVGHIIGTRLYTANVGDAEVVLGKKSTRDPSSKIEAELMTKKHNPLVPSEKERLLKAGAAVSEKNGRLFGMLAVSRSFGDRGYKLPWSKAADFVLHDPFVNVRDLTPDYRFMVICCDGVFDVIHYQRLVEIVDDAMSGKWDGVESTPGTPITDPAHLARILVKQALHDNTQDNCTAIVVLFSWNNGGYTPTTEIGTAAALEGSMRVNAKAP